MHRKIIIILFIVAVVIIGVFSIFYFLFYNPRYDVRFNYDPSLNDSLSTGTQKKWESRIDGQANVTVTVTPTGLGAESEEWKFNVVMDTHSVELNHDMTKVAMLMDDQGKEYKALGWEGPTGGHHREGILTFGKIAPAPKSIELKISGIGSVIRSFMWKL